MKTNIASTLLLCASFLTFGCSKQTEQEKVEEELKAYATAYFNWDFPSADKFITPNDKRQLTFLASQVTEQDIKAINEKEVPATIEIMQIEMNEADDEALATIMVSNYLPMDSIGKTPQSSEGASFQVIGTKHQKEWKFSIPLKVHVAK